MSSPQSRLPKASDLLVSGIREKIITARLPVGARLPSETELMELYGLGRATVREGLRLLEREGLVDIKRGSVGGIYVRHADIRQVSESLTLLFSLRDTTLGEFAAFRLLVEPKVAALAAENATDEQRTVILATGNMELGVNLSAADLHSVIATACGNDVFEFALRSIDLPLARHIRRDRVTEHDSSATVEAHKKIAKAIAAGKAAAAEKAMITHLEAYAEYLDRVGLTAEPIVPRSRWLDIR
jgi:GntR family transcriptional repressor for pyruvate dehydrogenase complex